MSGFTGWFLAFVLVIAIFNAEKLPDLKQLLEEKFKNSVDAAKEGSKLAKHKIKQVRTDMENKKNSSNSEVEAEENTPEEIEESLKFMGNFINKSNQEQDTTKAQIIENHWQDAYAEEEKLELKEPMTHVVTEIKENVAEDEAPVVLDEYVAEGKESVSDTENLTETFAEARVEDKVADPLVDVFEKTNTTAKTEKDPLEEAFK